MDISLGTKDSRPRRIALRVLLIGLVTIGSVLVPASSQARETAPETSPQATYATPLDSLGGLSLAQYLADHQAHVLGPVGV